jgi:hypothetical protein
MDGADMLVYQDSDALPIITSQQVDGHIPAMSSQGCALAGIEVAMPRQ